jgi:hypothetical protein
LARFFGVLYSNSILSPNFADIWRKLNSALVCGSGNHAEPEVEQAAFASALVTDDFPEGIDTFL